MPTIIQFGDADPQTKRELQDPALNKCEKWEYTLQTQGTTQTIRKPSNDTCAYAVAAKTGINAIDISAIEMGVSGQGCDPNAWGSVFMFGEGTWDGTREVDFMESLYGPGGIDSINSNFDGHGQQKRWGECQVDFNPNNPCPPEQFTPIKMSSSWGRHVSTIFHPWTNKDTYNVFTKNCDPEYQSCFSDADLRDLNDETLRKNICDDLQSNVA